MSKKIIIDIFITLLCVLATYWLHTHTFLNHDVAWHIEAASRLFKGGDYLVNLFDTNSPVVFVYFYPVIWLQKILNFSYLHISIIYILSTALLSLFLNLLVINKHFSKNQIFAKRFLYYLLIFILFFLPAFNFGHREVTLIYFYLPYFCFYIFETNRKESLSYWLPVTLAVIASFGITQNFFYITIPIYLDIYRYIKTRKFYQYQLVFYACILLQILFTTLLYPNYFSHIIPMILCYESGFNFPLMTLFLETLTFLSLLTVTIIVINFRKLRKSNDIVMTFIAAICSLLIYFFEQKLWYYHLYPAVTFVCLILGLLIIKYYEELFLNTKVEPRITLLSASLSCAILVTIFLIITTFAEQEIAIYNNQNSENNRWIRYANQHFGNKKLFFLVLELGPAYLLPFYGNNHVKIVSPWSNPWPIPYMITHSAGTKRLCALDNDIKLFQQLAANAIAYHKPEFIITEKAPASLYYLGRHFNYLTFFSQNKEFATLLKKYHHYGFFDKYIIYQITN